MKFLRYCAVALALAAMTMASPAFAATPVQGVANGGAYLTIKVNKAGYIIGSFVDDPSTQFSNSVSLADTTLTALHAAGAASYRVCMTWLDFSGIATTTAVALSLKDGSTVKFAVNILAGGTGKHIEFPTPICGTAATAMNVVLSGAPTGAVIVNGGGYITQ